jgi:glycosyltransferase involved in cell wall biosynthesis
VRIVVGLPQVPFAWGGAERLASGLVDALREAGHQSELVTVPFRWYPHSRLVRSMLMWRMADLTESNGLTIDVFIGTKFPSYLALHPNKVVWLVHQYRQAYDWYGTALSDLGASGQDQALRRMVEVADRRALSEARALFAISNNVARRLERFLGLQAKTLYPPTTLRGLAPKEFGDFILTVGRLDKAKRFHLLIESLFYCRSGVRAVIVGAGPEEGQLRNLAARLGILDRIQFAGAVSDVDLVELYNSARFVWYAPVDEDYGYVALEALMAGKPVVTADDAGGVLEFVQDEKTGLVVAPDPRSQAEALDRLWSETRLAREMGRAGMERVAEITWPSVIKRLLG